MRNLFFGLALLILMISNFIEIGAQKILIVEKNNLGNTAQVEIDNIKKIIFSESDMLINTLDGNTASHVISDIKKLTFDGITTKIQLPEDTFNKTSLYPNPAQNYLFIDNSLIEDGEVKIEIIDIQGKVLLIKILETSNKLSISHLKKGMYICRIHMHSEVKNCKFLKQ